jgi:hypothetical protein
MKKKYLFAICVSLLTCGCSQTGRQADGGADEPTDREKDSTAVTSFVETVYKDVLSAYNKRGAEPDAGAFDKQYLSADFLMWQEELEKVAAKHPGEIVGPEGGDHWIQGQDWDLVGMQIDSLWFGQDQPAVFITINHSGNCVGSSHLQLLLSKDDTGNWRIDDFVSGASEKNLIKSCVAGEQIGVLYEMIIKDCKRQTETRDYTSLDDFNDLPYLTHEYHRLYQQVDSMDDANRAEGGRFFNYDHWGLGQEFYSIEAATVSECSIMDDGRADVMLDLTVKADYIRKPDTSHESRRLFLKWEDGQWRVDDFVSPQGLSEKALMKEYLQKKE